MTRISLYTFVALQVLSVDSVLAQAPSLGGPSRGVVWTPPSAFADIRGDLEAISQHGANAVRQPLVLDPNLHDVADFFSITVYQELGARFLPAIRVVEHEVALVAALDSALDVAARAGGRHRFGLGYWIDTSVSATCEVLQRLSGRVHRRLPDAQTYYVSAFIESDICASSVDFVLLDADASTTAADMIRRWRGKSETPVGIASIGFTVRDDAGYGYLVKHSPEYQARMLESSLTGLLADRDLRAVFVEQWRARESRGNGDLLAVTDRGLVTPDGTPRPASTVVKGLYTGNQRVFAIDAGDETGNDLSWVNLISFLSVALFGLTYYGSIGLRSIVRRYFLSHAIYIEKLGDGREATVGTSMFLLLCLSLAASVVGMSMLTDLSGTRLWFPILDWVPGWLSDQLQIGVARSGMLVLAFAAIFALEALVWAVVLSLSTRGEKHLRFGQTLLCAVMPRWPVALIGLLALVMLNWRIDAPGLVLIAIVGFWFAVVLTYTGRMFSDFLRLLGIRGLWTIPVLLLGLVFLAAVVWLLVATNNLVPELEYLWNLARKT